MEKFLKEMFYNHIARKKQSESIRKLNMEIEINKDKLKISLNKNQKKLLLRVIDSKDLIEEMNHIDSYTEGFKIGLKIGCEVYKEHTS